MIYTGPIVILGLNYENPYIGGSTFWIRPGFWVEAQRSGLRPLGKSLGKSTSAEEGPATLKHTPKGSKYPNMGYIWFLY